MFKVLEAGRNDVRQRRERNQWGRSSGGQSSEPRGRGERDAFGGVSALGV